VTYSPTLSRAVPSALRDLTSVFGMGTGVSPSLLPPETIHLKNINKYGLYCLPCAKRIDQRKYGQAARPISIGKLRLLPALHLRPINLVFSKGALGACATGDLILRWASHLDAFSGYPIRTQLPSHTTGVITESPEVRPSRSSRTRDRSSQISCARGR
jgi:hypothetical protein